MQIANTQRQPLSFNALHGATQHLVDGQMNPDARVGIRRGNDGAIQIYQRTKDLGLIERFRQRLTGGDPLRRELLNALKAVARDQTVWQDAATSETVLDLLHAIRNSKGGVNLMQLHNSLQLLSQARSAQADAAPGPEPTGSTVSKSLASPAFRALAHDLAAALKSGDQKALTRMSGELGTMFGKEIGESSRDTQTLFAVADGTRFRADVKAALLSAIAADDLKTLMKADVNAKGAGPMAAFMSAVFEKTLDNLPDRITDLQTQTNDKGEVTRQDIKSLVIDGHTYVQDKQLAEGGFGRVVLFSRQDAPGEKVIVKIPLAASKDKPIESFIAEGRKEVVGQLAATQGAAPNIIGIKGAVRMPGGAVAIVQEFAADGNVDDFLLKLSDAQSSMDATDVLNMRLTLFRDMLGGLDQMQTNGVTHLDLKGPNIFIHEGQAKIGDFGTSATQERRHAHDGSDKIDNPLWRYPLLKTLITTMQAQRKEAAAPLATQQRAAMQERNVAREMATCFEKKLTELGALKAGLEQKTRSAQEDRDLQHLDEQIGLYQQQLTQAKTRHDSMVDEVVRLKAELDAFTQAQDAAGAFDYDMSGYAADNWSVAITAYELFTGRNPFDNGSGFLSAADSQIEEFMQMSIKDKREYLFAKVDDAVMPPAVKETIWKLMSFHEPTSADDQVKFDEPTVSPAELLKADIFGTPGVGTPATRSLISQFAKSAPPAGADVPATA